MCILADVSHDYSAAVYMEHLLHLAVTAACKVVHAMSKLQSFVKHYIWHAAFLRTCRVIYGNVTTIVGGVACRTLYCFGCCSLDQLPGSFGALASLQVRSLSLCWCAVLPDSVSGVVSLRLLKSVASGCMDCEGVSAAWILTVKCWCVSSGTRLVSLHRLD